MVNQRFSFDIMGRNRREAQDAHPEGRRRGIRQSVMVSRIPGTKHGYDSFYLLSNGIGVHPGKGGLHTAADAVRKAHGSLSGA